jgi:RNA polymerase sigma factor (sigma-70 family)
MHQITAVPPDFFQPSASLESKVDGLLAAAMKGGSDAFEDFYNATIRHLLPTVRRICGDDHADDVLADTYFQIWQTMHTYDGVRGGAVAWLRMVAASRARDRARRERVRHGGLSGALDYDPDGCVCDNPGPAEIAQTRQEQQRLYEALNGLPAREQGVLRMYIDDRTHDEISAAMGLPVGTVKTVILRSRVRLHGRITASTRDILNEKAELTQLSGVKCVCDPGPCGCR